MPQLIRRSRYPEEIVTPVIGKNSEALTAVDAVFIDSAGFLAKVTTSSKVFGVTLTTKTLTSDNQTVAKFKPQIKHSDGLELLYGASAALAQTNVGEYTDFDTVTTGAFRLNATTAAAAQTLILEFDPDNDGTTTNAVVSIAEPQHLAFAQA